MTRRAGYSLFEVLIAFVIMSLVLAALIPGQAQLLGRAAMQEEQLLAYDYALSRIAALETAPLVAQTQQDSYRDWEVTTEVLPGGALANGVDTIAITIVVRDQQNRILATAETLKVAR
ncbi:type IV pilus modification PilV family protein [Loktanella sp. Alg231-35]|uniref:type IV pilus modification PilV family protein n=1 Tax=Loktanella sp. Alg231-35 TaxID=1922220 RepID=UPI000D556A47|nr:type II secretion system protein [Loktanella sp. Alg231-35]